MNDEYTVEQICECPGACGIVAQLTLAECESRPHGAHLRLDGCLTAFRRRVVGRGRAWDWFVFDGPVFEGPDDDDEDEDEGDAE